MKAELLSVLADSATVEFNSDDLCCDVYINSVLYKKDHKDNLLVISNLSFDTSYEVSIDYHNENEKFTFWTKSRKKVINVKEFGAIGDGIHDDTAAINATIYACPKNGLVIIPKGVYLVGIIMLKSHVNIKIEEGAEIKLVNQSYNFPTYPELLTIDESHIYAAMFTGFDVNNICIYGGGKIIIDSEKIKNTQLIFLFKCENISIFNLNLENNYGPAIRIYNSENINLFDLNINGNSSLVDAIKFKGVLNFKVIGIKINKFRFGVSTRSGTNLPFLPGAGVIRHCQFTNLVAGIRIIGQGQGLKYIEAEQNKFELCGNALTITTLMKSTKYSFVDEIHFKNNKIVDSSTCFLANVDGDVGLKRIYFENITISSSSTLGQFKGHENNLIDKITFKNITFNNQPITIDDVGYIHVKKLVIK